MTAQCTGTPVSWLRLEQWALGELAAEQAAAVAAPMDECEACRACADQAAVQAVGLLPLPAPAPRRRPWLWWASGGLAAAAAVAILILMLRPRDDRYAGTKGGDDLAVELVREHRGAIAADPQVFAPGDRFKVLVTCAGGARQVDVVVYQEGETSFPLAAVELACGNRVAVPGAFTLTGGPARVCVVASADADAAPSRDSLRADGAPADAVCVEVSPAP